MHDTGPEHMKVFVEDRGVVESFKDVALKRSCLPGWISHPFYFNYDMYLPHTRYMHNYLLVHSFNLIL